MLLAASGSNNNIVLLNPGNATPGASVYFKGIENEPVKILEFEEFKKIKMTVDNNQNIVYNGKMLISEIGPIITDKNIEIGSIVS
jgi:hypothetical protein